MRVEAIDNRTVIERRLRRDAPLHLYELGDLDDFFFPFTTYFGLVDEREDVAAMGLLYRDSSLGSASLVDRATDLPVLVAMGHDRDADRVRALVRAIRDRLPARVYTHLAPGTSDAFGDGFRIEPHGLHDRMVLVDRSKLDAIDIGDACALGPEQKGEVEALFARAYPGNWFMPRMLETKTYFGVRREGLLVAVAGVHVVSRALRVAALGNITTDPAHRGKGLGRITTAAVCRALGREIDPIGLNVESTNASAIALYRTLGFERIASYEEALVTREV